MTDTVEKSMPLSIRSTLAAVLCLGFLQQAAAWEIETDNPDWTVRWDNTIKFNYGMRVEKPSPDVYLQGQNAGTGVLADDGDLGWKQWDTTSTRLDILSEFDAVYQDRIGVRISGAGWYDYAYHGRSDFPVPNPYYPAPGRNTWGGLTSAPGELNSAGERWSYFGGELLDAFIFGSFDIGSVNATVRAGQHTIYWGNSLLGTGAVHGVASAMVPMNMDKALAVPGSEAQELFLPTTKISTVVQITPNLTFNAYYELIWQETRLPVRGTYLSPAEILGYDPELLMLAPGVPGVMPRIGQDKVHDGDPSDAGSWGINLQYYFTKLDTEAQFFYLNYSSNIPDGLVGTLDFGQAVATFGAAGVPPFSMFYPTYATPPTPLSNDAIGIGQWKWNYKDDVDLYGFSLSKEIAGISFGLEYVRRDNAPLRQDLNASVQLLTNIPQELQPILGPGVDIDATGSSHYIGPVGSTNHIVVNAFGLLNGSKLWDAGAYIIEYTASETAKIKSDPYNTINKNIKTGRWSSNLSVNFIPEYYQVFAGVDLQVPLTIGYTFGSNEPAIGNGGNPGVGTASAGLVFNIKQEWQASFRYNMFFGDAEAGLLGLLTDRDNIAITIKRTF